MTGYTLKRGDYVRTPDGARGMIIGSWGIRQDAKCRVDFLDGTTPLWYRRDELIWPASRP